MNKICVYTCITGNYDCIKEIKNPEQEIDYYCFTNNRNIKSNTWNVVYIDNDENLSDVILARKIKILGHPIINQKYDILLWMDGSVTFNKSIKEFINYYLGDDDYFVAFKHSKRKNIQEECYACVKMRKEKKEIIQKLLDFYNQKKYKYDNGLIESTVYIKKTNNEKVEKTLRIWFEMVKNFSKRDQLSFNYAISESGLTVKWINENVFDNKWFYCKSHNYDKKIKSYRVYFNSCFNDEYNMNNDFQGDLCSLGNGKYLIDLVVPCDTQKTVVELPRIPFIKLKELQINEFNNKNIHFFNSLKHDEYIFFYNENGAFEFYDKLNKNDKLSISMILEPSCDEDLIDLIECKEQENKKISNENQKLKEIVSNAENEINILKSNNLDLKNELNSILNSKGWKLIRKFDNFRKK